MADIKKFVIMGVSGSGKSSVGAALSEKTGAPYVDGDDLHPKSNIEKMSAGIPLTDEDRWPWLAAVGERLGSHKGEIFIGCSALKHSYRDLIREKAGEPVLFIHLTGAKEVIAERMKHRPGHFMPTSLLDNQFATLEPPGEGELFVDADIGQPLDEVVRDILNKIGRN